MQLLARERVGTRLVFTLDGRRTFTWVDVVALAAGDGTWDALVETSRQGLACQARVAAAGEEVAAQAIVDAAQRFRYERGLIAGDDLRAWLEQWDVSEAEWRDHLRRSLLRERFSGELAETRARFPVADDAVGAILWPDAVCFSLLTRAAERVAADAALAAETGEPADRDFAVVRRAAAHARAEAVTDDAIAHEISLHRLEWLRVDGELLAVQSLDVAREARLCIEVDRRPFGEVAADCATEAISLRAYVGDLDPQLGTALTAARPGDIVGPVELDGGYAVMRVDDKSEPDADDADVRRRAEERLGARATERALREHVEWHERL